MCRFSNKTNLQFSRGMRRDDLWSDLGETFCHEHAYVTRKEHLIRKREEEGGSKHIFTRVRGCVSLA
jgi:hypothetical protein